MVELQETRPRGGRRGSAWICLCDPYGVEITCGSLHPVVSQTRPPANVCDPLRGQFVPDRYFLYSTSIVPASCVLSLSSVTFFSSGFFMDSCQTMSVSSVPAGAFFVSNEPSSLVTVAKGWSNDPRESAT